MQTDDVTYDSQLAANRPVLRLSPQSKAGISIGMVDYGFDILHPSLQRRSVIGPTGMTSRIAALLDQNSGRLLLRDGAGIVPAPSQNTVAAPASLDHLINAASNTGDRAAADRIYDPHRNYYDATDGRHGAHGTMMASIALRPAPFDHPPLDVDLIAVQLALPQADWREIGSNGRPSWLTWDPAAMPIWSGWRNYLDNARFADAINWVYEAASRRGDDAVIINLSLGTWAGAHDGRSHVERTIADVVARGAEGDETVAAVVVPTGNAGADRGHASGVVRPGMPWSVEWLFADASSTLEKLEVWYEADRPLTAVVDVGSSVERTMVDIGRTADLRIAGRRFGVADHRFAASAPLSAVRISCSPAILGVKSGPLKVTLSAPADAPAARVHAWVERSGDGRARSWLTPHDPASTIGGLATAPGAVVVGALDITAAGPARPFAASGSGPHPWQRDGDCELPHVWASGHRVRAALSKHGGFTVTSGTSAACAAVSGHLAIHLAAVRADALSRGLPVRPALRTAIAAARDGTRRVAADTAIDRRGSTAPHRQLETSHP